MLTKLKDTVDKQREDLRKQKREIKQRTVDCEAVGLMHFSDVDNSGFLEI